MSSLYFLKKKTPFFKIYLYAFAIKFVFFLILILKWLDYIHIYYMNDSVVLDYIKILNNNIIQSNTITHTHEQNHNLVVTRVLAFDIFENQYLNYEHFFLFYWNFFVNLNWSSIWINKLISKQIFLLWINLNKEKYPV